MVISLISYFVFFFIMVIFFMFQDSSLYNKTPDEEEKGKKLRIKILAIGTCVFIAITILCVIGVFGPKK
jgi:Na+/H+ antiporter NhaD/arsenite permease-like protein